jgi:hypothetical protein
MAVANWTEGDHFVPAKPRSEGSPIHEDGARGTLVMSYATLDDKRAVDLR